MFTLPTGTRRTMKFVSNGVPGTFDYNDFSSRDLEPCQIEINRLGVEHASDALHQLAAHLHADYPQYEGHFDEWTPYVIRSRMRFKGGDLEAGDVVLISPDNHSVFTPRNGHVCGADWF